MGQEVKDHLRRALSLMMKPLIRLLIAQGVTHAEFSETAKDVYVEVALREFEKTGKVNKSRVAILTGLTRKEVKNVIDRALESSYLQKTQSRPERVLTGWYSDPMFQGPYGIPLELPYESTADGEPDFVLLVKNYSGDMAPRQMLNQLLEAGSVVEVDKKYKAVSRVFMHMKLSPPVVDRLGSVGHRFFSTAAKNIDADREAGATTLFDRMVFADDGCTDEVISQFASYLNEKGQKFLEELDVWFSSRKDLNKESEERKETGVYMLHFVEEKDHLGSLQELLHQRGISQDD
ncbi:MAG: hypothetical protein K0U72_04445 [Gammaproteobacteria bacterium]|nr:hypothetical protein [Gammaproteobacteria bacterium]